MRLVTVKTLEGSLQVALQRPSVLVAEDDGAMRALVVRQLRRAGCDVDEAASGDEAIERISDATGRQPPECYDLIIADVRMPGMSGLELLSTVRRRGVAAPVILITAFGDRELHAEAQRLGALAVFDKPFDIDELSAAVLDALPSTAD